ncbi:hypothetical protein [Enterococcus canis]|jgi:hypothetical protein|uniref:hypothetical protein n=1 Tax=Enterococcus canis TaxID=214095 RepID=UPI000830F4A0|nr:hypothetical protein [Enterococcus canis]
MATFGRKTPDVGPSDLGKAFSVDTPVTFTVYGRPQTGRVAKQLKNSAVVEIDETRDNAELVNQSNGVVLINYKKLQKVESDH